MTLHLSNQKREAHARRVLDAELGMRWFNALAEHQRALWLTRAGSACPADAWALYKAISGKEVNRP